MLIPQCQNQRILYRTQVYTDESLSHQRIPGRLKGQFTVSENFYESDEEIISLFEGE